MREGDNISPEDTFEKVMQSVVEMVKTTGGNISVVFTDENNPDLLFEVSVDDVVWITCAWKDDFNYTLSMSPAFFERLDAFEAFLTARTPPPSFSEEDVGCGPSFGDLPLSKLPGDPGSLGEM